MIPNAGIAAISIHNIPVYVADVFYRKKNWPQSASRLSMSPYLVFIRSWASTSHWGG